MGTLELEELSELLQTDYYTSFKKQPSARARLFCSGAQRLSSALQNAGLSPGLYTIRQTELGSHLSYVASAMKNLDPAHIYISL